MRQVIFEMRHHPVATWITIIGTALAVCLISVVTMVETSSTVNVAPERHRADVLVGKNIHVKYGEGGEWSSLSDYPTAKRLYDSIEGIAETSFLTQSKLRSIEEDGKMSKRFYVRGTDDAFWHFFDFNLLAGRVYNRGDFEAANPKAVIAENVARHFFGSADNAIGKELVFENRVFTVVGVVDNQSSLLRHTFADVYYPFTAAEKDRPNPMLTGDVYAVLLPDGSKSVSEVKNTVRSRYATMNAELAAVGQEAVYHQQPYVVEEAISFMGSNTDPGKDDSLRRRMIYAILLIVPAINLSTMTRARLTSRMAEIGVRRAFGCTRLGVLADILTENFMITLAGGIIGFALSIVVCYCFTELIMVTDMFDDTPSSCMRLSPWMLVNTSTLCYSLAFCFILNMLSAFVPALKAARCNVTEAISANKF